MHTTLDAPAEKRTFFAADFAAAMKSLAFGVVIGPQKELVGTHCGLVDCSIDCTRVGVTGGLAGPKRRCTNNIDL